MNEQKYNNNNNNNKYTLQMRPRVYVLFSLVSTG